MEIVDIGARQGDWQTMIWHVRDGGMVRQDVSIACYMPEKLEEPALFMGGLGEERRAAPYATQVLQQLGIDAVSAIPCFHYLKATESNLRRTCIEAPQAVAEGINQLAGRNADTPMPFMGKSQSGGMAIIAASNAPEKVQALAVIAPVGLTNEFLGKHHAARVMRFAWRLGVINTLRPEQRNLFNRGNWEAAREIWGRIIKDACAGRLGDKFRVALGLDLIDDVKRLALDWEKDVAIFVGEHDPLFRPDEFRQVLGEWACEDLVHTVSGSHCPLTTIHGQEQVREAGEWLNNILMRQRAAPVLQFHQR